MQAFLTCGSQPFLPRLRGPLGSLWDPRAQPAALTPAPPV